MRTLLLLGSLLLALSCAPKASNEENSLAQISDPEVMKYAISGKQLYESYCANCHQTDGSGLGKLIPPLRDADYFKASIPRTAWIIRHGQSGEITVNGQKYDHTMPPNPTLKPLDIAQITTYLYNIWGMNEGVITGSDIESYLKNKPEDY
jgi:cytochrome c551